MARSSDWTPEHPLTYGADQIIVWRVHKQLHIIAPSVRGPLWLCLDVADRNTRHRGE